jgi:two-component system response regulator DctR
MSESGSDLLIRLVDDDDMLRASLEFLLRAEGWDVKGYASAELFLREDAPSVPGCIVLDVRMERMSGIELQQELVRRGNLLPIVFLTGHGDMQMAVEAMKRGAVDFVAKPIDPEAFVAAIRAALRKTRLKNAGIPERSEAVARYALVTDREKETLRLLARGLLNREVASRLAISERTVEGHRASAFKKLGIRTVSDLVLFLDQLPQ